MIKKLLAKLVNWSEQRENFSRSRFQADQEDQTKLARERHEQIMAERNRKYVSERTIPAESEIFGPSGSALKKEEK